MRLFLTLSLLIGLLTYLFLPSGENYQEGVIVERLRTLLANPPPSSSTPVTTPINPERERRDVGVTAFLEPAIGTEGRTSCSGTIVYYDGPKATAYILGCAHCYKGLSEQLKVRTYFVNGKREVREFRGTIVAIDPKEDLVVITFQPDFIPNWVPIGPKDSPYYHPTEAPIGRRIVVTGRDAGLPDKDRRPAAYEAFIREDDHDRYLESRQSQSRGGRSGGGVMTTNRQWLIGVNHGRGPTAKEMGHGLWTPLHRIHKFLKANDLEWLANVGDTPRHLPIVDDRGNKYPTGYIPRLIPSNQYTPLDGGEITPPSVSIELESNCRCSNYNLF
jgi:hypothetical protein